MLERGRAFLERKGLESPRLEAELLVAHALGLDRLQLFLALERPVDQSEVDAARVLLVRRAAGEPAAYLTGTREFYGRAFRVGPGVLIPRPETELLVDRARAWLAERTIECPRIADVGTGSGCIAVTLALEVPEASVVATELSSEALAYARENAASLGAEVVFIQGDGLDDLPRAPSPSGSHGGEGYDVVLCNPPYVDPQDSALAEDVRKNEPAEALFAPAGDPDHWVRRLADAAAEILAPDGVLLVELAYDQGARAERLAAERGLRTRLHNDHAGVARVLEAQPARAAT
ncbi:MAG: peptide chain release factor N(5)-glutamine methyltransferase [Planctomycetota bacterium]|nr:peptide chain release factor N(5)-glutamine methyltransferase [Planctomycetota bacterium]